MITGTSTTNKTALAAPPLCHPGNEETREHASSHTRHLQRRNVTAHNLVPCRCNAAARGCLKNSSTVAKASTPEPVSEASLKEQNLCQQSPANGAREPSTTNHSWPSRAQKRGLTHVRADGVRKMPRLTAKIAASIASPRHRSK